MLARFRDRPGRAAFSFPGRLLLLLIDVSGPQGTSRSVRSARLMFCVVVVGGAETDSICKATSVAVGMAGRETVSPVVPF